MNGKATPPTTTRSSKQNSAADYLEHLNVDGNKAEAKKVLLNSLESILESVQLSDAHRLQKKVRKFAASLETPAVGAPLTREPLTKESRLAFERLLEELTKSARKCQLRAMVIPETQS